MKDIFVLYGSLFKCIYKRQICKQNIIHANEINFLRTENSGARFGNDRKGKLLDAPFSKFVLYNAVDVY